jgi:hypothetical protein
MEVVKEQRRNAPESAAANAGEEIVSLKARQQQLLVLVGELLRTNEDLRQKVAGLEAQGACAGMN